MPCKSHFNEIVSLLRDFSRFSGVRFTPEGMRRSVALNLLVVLVGLAFFASAAAQNDWRFDLEQEFTYLHPAKSLMTVSREATQGYLKDVDEIALAYTVIP